MTELPISESLVKELIATQFPDWASLPVTPVEKSGWDNRTFHLGEKMTVRLPSHENYAHQVVNEAKWLPYLSSHLTLKIPKQITLGRPTEHYPFHWGIYEWLPGQTLLEVKTLDYDALAKSLAAFLKELHSVDTSNAPTAGPQNFYRGGLLSTYNAQFRQAVCILKTKVDATALLHIWEQALSSKWERAPVWVHGDISAGNLLVDNRGQLSAVIDFGVMAVGDPACDLVIGWTNFDAKARQLFEENLALDEATYQRSKGWALWKACIVSAGLTNAIAAEQQQAQPTINAIVESL